MTKASAVKRVLIFRPGSLGDTVVALPCFHLIARCFPNAERMLLNDCPASVKAAPAAAVLGDSGLIHQTINFAARPPKFRDALKVAGQVRRFHPDLVIYLAPMRGRRLVLREWLFFTFLCGIWKVVGARESFGAKRRLDAASGMYEHESVRLAGLIRELGDSEPQNLDNWNLLLNDTERKNARTALGKLAQLHLIVCGPSSNRQSKDWGTDNWQELFKRIWQLYPEYGLVMVGAKEDTPIADQAALLWQSSKVNLCGALTPRETAAVLERASIYVGPDSGPMHLAAAAGVPCVALFSGMGLPGAWYPVGDKHQVIYHKTECYGCNLETCIVEKQRCMVSISVNEVIERIMQVLSPTRKIQLHVAKEV